MTEIFQSMGVETIWWIGWKKFQIVVSAIRPSK
jgi:hypothetical protein